MRLFVTENLEFEFEDNIVTIRDNYISEEEMTKREFWEFISRLQDMYNEFN